MILKNPIQNFHYFNKLLLVLALCGFLNACNDSAIYDTSKAVTDNKWKFKDKKDNYVEIKDLSHSYDLYYNVRITNNYRYSNMFVLLHIFSPKSRVVKTTRLEFKLASADGEWLGKGSGTIFTYRIPFAHDVRFDKAGVYNFQLEQNMRDSSLADVVDAGMRIEKSVSK